MSSRHWQHSTSQGRQARSGGSRSSSRASSGSSNHQNAQNQGTTRPPTIPDFSNPSEAITPFLENLNEPHVLPQISNNVTLSDIDDMFRGAPILPFSSASRQSGRERERHASSGVAAPSIARGSRSASSRHAGTSRGSEHSSAAWSSHPTSGVADQYTGPLVAPSIFFGEDARENQRPPFGTSQSATRGSASAASHAGPALSTYSTTDVSHPTASRKRTAPAFGPSDQENPEKRDRKQCNKCGGIFANRAQALMHQKACEAIYKCPECDFTTPYPRVGERHRAIHERRTCIPCNETFNSRYAFNEHNRIFHSTIEPLPCNHCDRIFVKENALQAHMRTKHPFTGDIECRYCFRRFTTNRGMIRHVSSAHRSEMGRSVCDVCGKEFSNNYRLNQHKERKHRQGNNS